MTGKSPTCALVAASDFNVGNFRVCDAAGAFDCVVAVDAGFAQLESIHRVPDFVLGDFDSLGFVPKGANVAVHPSHKDESDLELALCYVEEKGFERVVVYGALGGRLDHTVAALQSCARYAEGGMEVSLVGAETAVHILAGPGTFEIPTIEAGTVSVFSATDVSLGVTELGMEYPLENACLTNRTALGLSNELVGKPASVSVERGTLYIFHPLPVL